jgi:hypothetical protein
MGGGGWAGVVQASGHGHSAGRRGGGVLRAGL